MPAACTGAAAGSSPWARGPRLDSFRAAPRAAASRYSRHALNAMTRAGGVDGLGQPLPRRPTGLRDAHCAALRRTAHIDKHHASQIMEDAAARRPAT